MFGLNDIVCCSGIDEEEEYSNLTCSASIRNCWDNGIELSCKQHNKSAGHCSGDGFADGLVLKEDLAVTIRLPSARMSYFLILDDWATALHAYHAKDVVHGNLTPESVDVVHGRGVLVNPGQRWSPDCRLSWDPPDEVYGARWTATELFNIDNDDPRPTKMSDVYSFACLMLQMLTGNVPYCGTKRPEQVVYLKYLGREPIDTQTPQVADRYVAFMRWCWSPDPEKRPTMEIVLGFIREELKKLGE